jgi:diguanylate cyclase (GGDEF)-like protein
MSFTLHHRRFWTGPLLTLIALGGIAWTNRYGFALAPLPVYTLTIVYAAYVGGMPAGMVSALIAIVYTALFFSKPGLPFQYKPDDLVRVMTFVLATPATAFLVSQLKRQAMRALAVERESRELAETANSKLQLEVLARVAAEEEARKMARHDPLTGLPNRRFFAEKLNEVLHGMESSGGQTAVLMLDLDGFKPINDTFGHAAGDQALMECAERMGSVIRSGTMLARVGGDEFAVILPSIASLDEPAGLARRIVGAFAEPFVFGDTAARLGIGVGIAVAPDDGMEHDKLVRRADLALYRAKAIGQSSIRFFESEMDEHLDRRMRIEQELRNAVTANAIVPYYQPLVSLAENRIIGFEALARWHSKELGMIAPDVFIAIAEECGLIGELGDRLLRRACLDAKTWPKDITLAFNISTVQLRNASLGLHILSILAETGFDPRRLEIEITESVLVDNLELAQRTIDELRQSGIRIALDDFGTGYATLAQLQNLHLDKIKIDRRFVDRVVKDKESLVIVRAILGLANGFGLATTAEGIEDEEQRACLQANGCQEAQGYLFSKAVPAAEVPALLSRTPLDSTAARRAVVHV